MGKIKFSSIALAEVFLFIVLLIFPGTLKAQQKPLKVGTKNFSEQRILGQIIVDYLGAHGVDCILSDITGRTDLLRYALKNGTIDIYMEYTGTALSTFLGHNQKITDREKSYQTAKELDLKENGIVWLPCMPFNNTYCFLMTRKAAMQRNIFTISELFNALKRNPNQFKLGVTYEFNCRPDGVKAISNQIGKPIPTNRIFTRENINAVYKMLNNNGVDVAVGFSTSGEIRKYRLMVLQDDVGFFPAYFPAPTVRKETAAQHPELAPLFQKLSKHLDQKSIRLLNYEVDIKKKNLKEVVKKWLNSKGLI